MYGRIVFAETKRVALRQEELAGVTFQTVYVPAHSPTRRRIRKAARLLCRSGVRRVLVPPDFSYWPQLERFDVIPVDPVPFLQAMAVPLALAVLADRGVLPEHATIVLAGNRVSKALRDAALALCPRIQQLVIFAPAGGEGLADYLRREYGLPLLEYCRTPHLVLLFSDAELEAKAPVLRICAPVPDLLGFSLRPTTTALPENCETISFLAALWEAGHLAARDIAVFPCEDT